MAKNKANRERFTAICIERTVSGLLLQYVKNFLCANAEEAYHAARILGLQEEKDITVVAILKGWVTILGSDLRTREGEQHGQPTRLEVAKSQAQGKG